ncbi:acyl-CoA thioesterase [Sphingomonas sp. HDW15A]|uniref:acyl-CoA thioesterase n=1 Tax=Sphingomonas sp. HDW15A TaxID=2714942 RepID=UPI00140946A4|nr:thioesterase family protein [Sphingomonas sp. HDW15A]QIK96131.1 acyl-CoA thioesterase [Sphingomonas sp. HDW15A]
MVRERPGPRPRSSYRYCSRITLRWADNDAYGHVNNTIYYAWFDTAVNQWLVENGLLDIMGGDPIGLLVETGCRYFSPLSYPGEVELLLAVQLLGRSSVTYVLGVFEPGAESASAEGHFTHVYVDRRNRRPTAIPQVWRQKLEQIA